MQILGLRIDWNTCGCISSPRNSIGRERSLRLRCIVHL